MLIFLCFCSGSVIGPTFHFDVPKLKFGTVSYGKFSCINLHCMRTFMCLENGKRLNFVIVHGSHWDWKSGKTWKNGKAFSSQGILSRLEKSENFTQKYWEKSEKIVLEN